MSIRRVNVGDTFPVKLPWSEVCMHMCVADLVMTVELRADGVQLLNNDGSKFSFPVTHGEAGIYSDAVGFYVQEG